VKDFACFWLKVVCAAGVASSYRSRLIHRAWLVTDPRKNRESWGAYAGVGQSRIQRPDSSRCINICFLQSLLSQPLPLGLLAGLWLSTKRLRFITVVTSACTRHKPRQSRPRNQCQNFMSRPQIELIPTADHRLKEAVHLSLSLSFSLSFP
jgi:hypothetical protein